MKKFPPLFCALLFVCAIATPLVAAETKSQQVEKYLGKYRYENDKPVGTVKFIFQKAVLKRKGDGQKSYQYLLLNYPYFSNEDNAGHLIGIQIVRKGQTTTIRPEAPDKTGDDQLEPPTPQPVPVKAAASPSASSDPVRPRSGGGSQLQLPDSSTLANNINSAKETVSGWKGKMWQSVRPIWGFVMWVFSSVIVLLICLAGLCRYVARTAASESLINSYGRIIVGRWIVSAHQNAAAMLLVITWIIAIVLLIDVFMWLVYLSLPIWLLVVIWFPVLWIAERITSWIVPNVPILGPGDDHP